MVSDFRYASSEAKWDPLALTTYNKYKPGKPDVPKINFFIFVDF